LLSFSAFQHPRLVAHLCAPLRTRRVRFRTPRSPVPSTLTGEQSKVLALSITDTSLSDCSKHLPPLALCVAFPRALVERYVHDYYGGSVALPLARRRPSQVPSLFDVSSPT